MGVVVGGLQKAKATAHRAPKKLRETQRVSKDVQLQRLEPVEGQIRQISGKNIRHNPSLRSVSATALGAPVPYCENAVSTGHLFRPEMARLLT